MQQCRAIAGSAADPTMHREKMVTPSPAWISAHPHVALPATSDATHISWNVLGDAALLPVQLPSSGPRETEARVQTDQGAKTHPRWMRGANPCHWWGGQDLATTFAALWQQAAPQPIQAPTALQLPLDALAAPPPPHVPRSNCRAARGRDPRVDSPLSRVR